MPVRTDSSPCARPRLWLAGVALSLGVGCGPLGGCHAAPSGGGIPADQPDSVSPEPAVEAPRKVVVVAPPGPTPMLTDEAREARLHAQRIALGDRAALLEDGAGQPFPSLAPLGGADPMASPAGPGLGAPVVAAGSLDALPGSQSEVSAVNGNLLGDFILLDGAGATGLTQFHEALRRLKRGEDADGKVRVLVYGASHTAADIYPSYLRAYLQRRFGDGGSGFVPIVRPSKFYRPLGLTLEASRGWKVEHAQKSDARGDGLFGLFGASAATSKKRDFGRVVPAVKEKAKVEKDAADHKTRYELFFLNQPTGGKFKLSVDGEVVATISTKSGKGKPASPGYHALTRDGGPHAIEVKPVGDGEVRLFGMTMENEQDGVVIDNLGIGGTRAANHLKWDEHVWADNVKRRAPDLVVLAYGTNESVDEDQPMSAYRENLRGVLARMRRAAPQASCLLVGPGDFPTKLADGMFGPRPRTVAIVQAQREVAGELGCAFWDMMQFMGGEQSMVTWAAASPAMAQSDHLHLTRRGYTRMGMALADALMFDYDAAGVPGPIPVHAGTELAASQPVAVPGDSQPVPADSKPASAP
jgi:lysophospholipase L1-like esterase